MVKNLRMSQNPSPQTKKDGGNNCREENHDYGQDRDERHSDSYRYNSDYVRIFYSIGIIEPDASQNIALNGVGKVTRKNIWGAFKGGRYNES